MRPELHRRSLYGLGKRLHLTYTQVKISQELTLGELVGPPTMPAGKAYYDSTVCYLQLPPRSLKANLSTYLLRCLVLFCDTRSHKTSFVSCLRPHSMLFQTLQSYLDRLSSPAYRQLKAGTR